jgi:hypothetical protein
MQYIEVAQAFLASQNLPILPRSVGRSWVKSQAKYAGPSLRAIATYDGLVWETRRDFTIESRFIDALVAEW